MDKCSSGKGSRNRGERLLTDAQIRTATRETHGPYLRDGGGLRIRLLDASRNYPRGAKLAEYEYREPGTGRQVTLGLGTLGEPFTDDRGATRPFTLADARAARDRARAQVAQGLDPRAARRLERAEAAAQVRTKLAELDTRRTVRQAFAEWQRVYLGAHRKDGGEGMRGMFELHVLPHIGDLALDDLRRPHVIDVLDKVTTAGKRRTANMVLGALRQLFRWCALRDWMTTDPTLGVTRAAAGGRERPRERVLSAMEVVELRDKLPRAGLTPRMQAAVWMLLATAARVGELSAARVADFDLRADEWHIPETKSGRAHVVHLSPFAVGMVCRLIALGKGSAYLLPARGSEPVEGEDNDDRHIGAAVIGKQLRDRQRVAPVRGRAKASDALRLARGEWTAHDLRRTAATMMRGLGASSDAVEKCLNHAPQGLVAVYQRDELLGERRAAFEALGAELERLMSLDASNVRALPVPRAAKAAA